MASAYAAVLLVIIIISTVAWLMHANCHFEEIISMPMREELFIPDGHPLDPGRSPTHSWRRILDHPDLNVITMFLVTGLLMALYMATHFPLPEEICAALMTTT